MAEEQKPKERKPLDSSRSYILRSLVEELPLSAEGQATDIHITCVELWGQYPK